MPPQAVISTEGKRRARWRRNKRAERERKRIPAPAELDPAIAEHVWRERDKRAQLFPEWLCFLPGWHQGRGSEAFQCDVWAAQTMLELQHGARKISDGMIARWMIENDLTHGYMPNSLRTMVRRAREAIEVLEKGTMRTHKSPAWPPFQLPQV